MVFRYTILALTTCILATPAQAGIITHGNLQTDTNGSVITDLLTGREYLRFDEFDLSYAEIVTATSAGGIYEDWDIATSEVADDFIEAALGNPVGGVPTTHLGDALDPNIYGQIAGTISSWSDGDFGASYSNFDDYFSFLSTQETRLTNGSPIVNAIGLARIAGNRSIVEFDDWTSVINLDAFSNGGNGFPINLLLYKNSSNSVVPEPTSAMIWSSLAGGLCFFRRRR